MADRSLSLPMTLSDLERPDAMNHFFFRVILITLVRSATSLHLHNCIRAICQRQLSFLYCFNAYSVLIYFVLRLFRSSSQLFAVRVLLPLPNRLCFHEH